MSGKNVVCLWFDGGIAQAADFYCRTFPDTWIGHSQTAPDNVPGIPQGDMFAIELTIMGVPTLLLNGGPHYKLNEAFSFQVATEDQAETDRLWSAITSDGGSEGQCGWCKDKWGVSWQIVPRQLTAALSDADRQAASRAQAAMMTMKKIDVAAIEAARKG